MNDNRNKRNLLTLSIIWFIISTVLNVLFTIEQYDYTHKVLIIATFISYILCIYTWISAGNRILSLYNFFIVYLLFSNMGQFLLHLIGFEELPLSIYNQFQNTKLNQILSFQLLCVSSMNIGTALFVRKSENRISINKQIECFPIKKRDLWDKPLDIIMFISLGYVVFHAIKLIILRQEVNDYIDFYEQKASMGSFIGAIFELLAIVLPLRAIYKGKYVKLITTIFIFLIVIYNFLGSRSLSIRYLGALIIYLPVVKPQLFVRKYIGIWIISAVIGFSLIGFISQMRKGEYEVTESLGLSLAKTSIEMGTSVNTLGYTIEVVKQTGTHYQTILYTWLTGLFSSTVTHSIGLEEHGFSLADWITRLQNKSSGLGYSFFAEAYENYGWYGWIYTLFYAWLIVMLEIRSYQKISQGKFFFATFVLAILCKQIFYARGEMIYILSSLRVCFYLVVLCIIFKSFYYKIIK